MILPWKGEIITGVSNRPMMVARAWASNYSVLLLVTVMKGVAGTVLNSNNAKLMSSWFSSEQLGFAIGVVVAACNGGTILARTTGGTVSKIVRKGSVYPWKLLAYH